MDLKHFQGYTSRKVINYSSLNDNQNWLFDQIYDMSAFAEGEFQVPIANGTKRDNCPPVFGSPERRNLQRVLGVKLRSK